jgi:hypothetical protein
MEQVGNLLGVTAADVKGDVVACLEAFAAETMAALDKSLDRGAHR